MVVCMVGCKNEDDILGEEPQTVKTPTEGSVVISELLKNGQVIEQSMDSLVNMGNEENPALFYINLSHTVNGLSLGIKRNKFFQFFTSYCVKYTCIIGLVPMKFYTINSVR